MGSRSQDRHVCHCGKSFLRKEHLRRHQATHGGPAFSCLVCGRSFSRSDLLRRHAGIHGAAAAVPDSRRGRACDTCHANKTKCDGGKQCSLCTKRGVMCTYGRRDENAADRVRRASPSSQDSLAERVSPPSVEPERLALPTSLLVNNGAVELRSHGTNEAEGFTTKTALQAILRAVASQSRKSPNNPSSPCAVPKSWLSACVESFLGAFHDRWPLLHAPSVDETNDSVAEIASIVMITSWLHYDCSLREHVIEIHDVLVEKCFHDLANDTYDLNHPWPLGTYQVALLNIIFAFETGRDSCIKRARRLLSLLIAALRQNNCFNAEAQEREKETHYPGDFVPWVFTTFEQWKRLAVCTLQIDVYLSLFCNQPPLLRREDLDLGLTSTFAMWNSYGLHIFFPRHRGEPWQRGAYKMSCLSIASQQQQTAGILVEDVQTCLLGTWNDIWLLQQLRRHQDETAALKADAISRELRLCKHQLDTIEDAIERPKLHGQYPDFLLRAYSGKGLPSEPKWRQRVLERLYSCIFTARMLHHLLSIHLLADVQAIRDVAQISPWTEAEAGTASPTWQRKAMQVQEWAMSADSRAAILQAMYVWRTYQEAAPGLDRRREPIDPIAYAALSAAATVLWAWTMNAVDACICAPELTKVDIGTRPLNVGMSPEVDDWVLQGGSSVILHGMPVCKCNAGTWLTRFAEGLARGGQRWETGSIIANVCLSKLAFT
ncbi:hypothetical protein DCS_07005 [Drechmeria coniospora]|uniref:Uncharacterized protein n=1 Tax=Drechmeria coniospora TaxID=98403 RepID=A0A151GD93_DRECN|nr:hypothetical protein DCS_07005 [Drechmeria coniospora]KYK55044.1 hypothetical protein DCS_07005 [Drechmeria coniospora]ODA82329.1 hypothetical protein RJ55_00836 [Drechmeria coniospora]